MASPATIRFDGRVAVVTGAGGGLGREYALALAKRGASVVVNDLGVDRKGVGKSTKLADSVVAEIQSFGGKAAANYDSVEDGERIIQTAIDNFGRVDILINNAGILRDTSFLRMTEKQWDDVQNVHLKGAYTITHAAWHHFRNQKYGRIVMTSSTSGTHGNFGQANYSAAKMGLIGLAKTLSIEGAKYGILCNVVVPCADSRLTQGVIPDDIRQLLHPKFVAPVVLYLCHESFPSSGEIYLAGGGVVQKFRIQNSKGFQFLKYGHDFGPESLIKHWDEIEMFEDKAVPGTTEEILMSLVSSISEEMTENSTPDNKTTVSSDKVTAVKSDEFIGLTKETMYTYTFKDVILYALGIGESVNNQDLTYLKYLYENHEDFSVLPTFAVIPSMDALELVISSWCAETGVNPMSALHGEHYVELFSPIPTSGVLRTKATIVDILDKGSGTLIIVDIDTYNEMNERVACNQVCAFAVGCSGYGAKRSSEKMRKLVKHPDCQPTCSVEEKTTVNQAALYRLVQDLNPLHIDPTVASIGGFRKPILHGLCTLGYAARHILRLFGNNDTKNFRSMKARFSKSVFPGQTLKIDMWLEGNRVHFEVIVKETNEKAVTGGYVDLRKVFPKDASGKIVEPETSSEVTVDEVFSQLEEKARLSPSLIKSIGGVVEWRLTKSGRPSATWVMDFRSSPVKVFQGFPVDKANVTLTMSEENLLRVFAGKVPLLQVYKDHLVDIDGDELIAGRVSQLFASQSKL